ncbi:MAG TPA: GTP-binding protein [Acidimicrobiales bacterium]|nr:GTP-binding protein [Acidimicrobiales bacterium]
MSEPTVPLTVLLGSSATAKADLLGRLADDDPGHLAVVCSGHDDVPAGALVVRGAERVAEQSLGCSCCALRLDVRRAVFRLLARRRPPGRIVIVAGAEADPGPLLATLLCDVHMVRRTNLHAVVAALDGPEAAVRLATGQPLALGVRAEEHIAVADGIVVLGTSRLTPVARAQLAGALRRLNPFEPWWADDDQPVPAPPATPQGTPYALGGLADRLDGICAAPSESSHSVFLDIEGEAEAEALRAWAQDLCQRQGARLLRLQAVCSLRGRTERWACSAVRSFYATSWCAPSPAGPARARVLAVGSDLDVDALAGSLRLALARA